MKNSELLACPDQFLKEVDRQAKCVLKIETSPSPCPMCFAMVNQVQASEKALDDFGADESEFRCPHCETELDYVVPFMSTGTKYRWVRKRSVFDEVAAGQPGSPAAEKATSRT